MIGHMKKRLFSLLPVLSLLLALASPAALAAETASTIKLSKTSGTVSVSKSSEKPLTLMSNMRLYNGYHVTTGAGSYAWINLDDTKLIKQDVSSEVEVRKSGKKLEVNVCSGNVFFNISEKLKDDESLNISTSTMIVGIRGTAGYVEMEDRWTTKVSILEGSAQCSVTDPVTGQTKTATVNGGETATCVVYNTEPGGTEGPGAGEPGTEAPGTGEKCDILMEQQTVETTPGFVLTDVVRDMELCDRIEAGTGTDLLAELARIVGGDPSGKSADGTSASPEILGEADRRESSQASSRQAAQQRAEAAQAGDSGDVSADKALGSTSGTPSSGGGSSSSGGSSGGAVTPPTPTTVTLTMPKTAAEVQTALNTYSTVTLQPDPTAAGGGSLVVDTDLTVPAGTTLTTDGNAAITVNQGSSFRVDGTAENILYLENNGDVYVNSSNTLYVKGDMGGPGSLTVTATGRLVVDGYFGCSGTLNFVPGTPGAQVLSRNGFDGITLPAGWYATGTGSYNGASYSALEYAQSHTVTFDPNGGVLSGGNTAVTAAGGKLSSLPAAPSRTANTGGTAQYAFDGWYTAADGGTEVTTDTVFTADATVYAHWTISTGWDWALNGTALTVSGTGAMTDFDTAAPPWGANITGVTIEEGVTTVGNAAFAGCTALTGVTLPESVASIGSRAFDGCTALSVLNFAGTREQWVKVNVPSGAVPDATTIRCSDGDLAIYTVTLDPNGGTLSDTDTTLQTDLFGKLSSLPADDGFSAPRQTNTEEPVPYAFAGWWTAAEGGTEVTTDTAFSANVTVYAHWTLESGWDWEYTDTARTALRIFGTGAMGDYGGGGVPWDDRIGEITSLTIEEGITTVGHSAFAGCTRLSSVTLPQSVINIGSYAFQDCTSLDAITFSSTVPSTFETLGLGASAFSGCTALTGFVIPTGVTEIQQYTFLNCTSLQSVIVPTDVTYIYAEAFEGCDGLTISYGGSEAQWNEYCHGTLPAGVTVTFGA